MINYCAEFGKKKFTAETMKAAYMKAVKWVATNVLSKDELHNVLVEYDKDKQSPTVTVHLYAAFPEKEVKEQHCKCCEEMHHSFFINENNNCNICAAAGFQNRLEQKMKIKQSYYKEALKRCIYMEDDE